MPALRKVIKPFHDLALDEIDIALASPVHEHRMAALLICDAQAGRARRRGDAAEQKRLYDFYLAHTARINNWDLVDVTCREVIGEYLFAVDDVKPLRKLARSKDIWERRIAMISTWSFTRAGRPEVAFEIAGILIDDEHDLIHKAVGWMLRDAGQRAPAALDAFLEAHAATMPRTALRYAIEKLPPQRRKEWLAHRA